MSAINVKFNCPECDTEHEFEVTPERPPPPCSNPSSPAYSDSGDPGEVNGPECCEKCGHNFEDNWDRIEEKAYEEYRDRECDYPDSDPSDYPDRDDFSGGYMAEDR